MTGLLEEEFVSDECDILQQHWKNRFKNNTSIQARSKIEITADIFY